MRKYFTTIVLLISFSTVVFAPRVFAKENNYFVRSGQKFSRGITNVVFCPSDFLKPLERNFQEDKVYRMVAVAPIEGVARILGRVLVGAYELTTFYIPQDPILKPVYYMPSIDEYIREGHVLKTQRPSVPTENSKDAGWY